MPRIKRYFPVSHNINRDPEVRELTDTFGDWLLPAWLEILAITDPNDGEWMGTPTKIAERLATLCLGLNRDKDQVRRRFKGTKAAYRAEIALYWMCLKHWLVPIIVNSEGESVPESLPNRAKMVAEWSKNGDRIIAEWSKNGWPTPQIIVGFKVRNYAKYHGMREIIKSPPSLPNQPILPKEALKSSEHFKNRIVGLIASMPKNGHGQEKPQALMLWVNGKRKEVKDGQVGMELIVQTLERLKTRETNGTEVKSYGRYLDALYQKVRTEHLQAENERLKHQIIPDQLKSVIKTVVKKV